MSWKSYLGYFLFQQQCNHMQKKKNKKSPLHIKNCIFLFVIGISLFISFFNDVLVFIVLLVLTDKFNYYKSVLLSQQAVTDNQLFIKSFNATCIVCTLGSLNGWRNCMQVRTCSSSSLYNLYTLFYIISMILVLFIK